MTRLLTSTLAETRTLDAADSHRILEQAVRSRAAARLIIALRDGETPVTARFAGSDAATVDLLLDDPEFVTGLLTAASAVHVTIESDDAAYAAETQVIDPPNEARPNHLRLRKPTSLDVLERRRSTRTPLHDPAPVTLHAGGAGTEAWQCTGDVLNLSLEGMACRVRNSDAAKLASARKIRAVFRVGRHPQTFDLGCRLSNTTQAATPDRVVLGIAFVFAANAQATQARLKSALDAG